MRRLLIATVTALAVLVVVPSSTADADWDDYFVDPEKLPFDPLPGHEDTQRFWGMRGRAGYRIEIPADWNGDVVMWAHGYRGEGFELTVDDHPIREHLIENGYAWAASSYSTNGYDVLNGVESTRRLLERFTNVYAPHPPEHVYLTGFSMGGHVTGVSIERYPDLYDGAMPMCGVMGDFELFDFFVDFNLAAMQLGLGESTYPVGDEEVYQEVTAPKIQEALEAVPGGWPLALNEKGQSLKDLTLLRSGGPRPNYDAAWAFWADQFLFTLTLGDGTTPNSRDEVVVTNRGQTYQLDLDPAVSAEEAAFNDAIFRVDDGATARKHGEAITGKIHIPVLSLHNIGDLFVTFAMEQDYARDVARFGKEHLLVTRAVRGVGHCDITEAEMATAFDDLVEWVEHGVRPEGDAVLDPAAVADPSFGCRFTDGAHLLGEPCPT